MYKKIIAISSLVAIALLVGIVFFLYKDNQAPLPLYFSYTEDEVKTLQPLHSSYTINQSDLTKWNDIAFDHIRKDMLGDIYVSRIFAYLYTAQRDAAFLTANIHHHMNTSLDPVSAETLCLFFTSQCSQIKQHIISDEYSKQLAQIIVAKMKTRMAEDSAKEHLYQPPQDNQGHWSGIAPYFGQSTGSWKTWFIASNNQFRAPIPAANDAFWQDQARVTKETLLHATDEQKVNVVYWAGGPGTATPPGRWLLIANKYMVENKLPLENQLFIRSVLAMGLADAVIAVFDSKYTYWMKRPFMRDSSIQTIMPTPNHPSYPAAHSTVSAAAATILSYYFPQNAEEWYALAHASSDSRVQGGIHFPIDIEVGFIQGTKIGDTVTVKAGKMQNVQKF